MKPAILVASELGFHSYVRRDKQIPIQRVRAPIHRGR